MNQHCYKQAQTSKEASIKPYNKNHLRHVNKVTQVFQGTTPLRVNKTSNQHMNKDHRTHHVIKEVTYKRYNLNET